MEMKFIKFHFSASNEVNGVTEANLNDHFELMGISCLQPSLNKIKIAALLLRQIMLKCTNHLVLFSLRQQEKINLLT